MNWTVFPAMQRAGAWLLRGCATRLRPMRNRMRARSHRSSRPCAPACWANARAGSRLPAAPVRRRAERSFGRPGEREDAGSRRTRAGLDALDELALRETGRRFARLGRRAQMRALFQLEVGRGRLSRRHASVFMDAFLALAAEAYLRDALQLAPAAPDCRAQRAGPSPRPAVRHSLAMKRAIRAARTTAAGSQRMTSTGGAWPSRRRGWRNQSAISQSS